MTLSIVLAAGKPWTYGFAPVLLTAALVLIAALAAGYCRRVAVPAFQWQLHDRQRRLAQQRRPMGTVHRLPQRRTSAATVKPA